MAFFKPSLLSLILSSLLVSLFAPKSAAAVSGTIERITKQHILATAHPGAMTDTPQPFLTSPSGRYAASFIRSKTAPGAGGFGNDFCYILVEDTSTGRSEWESECAPVTDANACTLVFTDAGLEVFDGSQSVWSTEADGDHVEELTLVDQGDMRIVDKDGELAWKASDNVRANQGCGLPGSVGLAPESPPFAGLIGGGNGPFGQPAVVPSVIGQMQQQQMQQQQIAADLTQSAAAPLANRQQQTAGDSLQSVAVAPSADEQQTVANCPLSPTVAPATDGQPQQTTQKSSTQSAAAPAADGQQQQTLGDSSQQSAVSQAADGQQQQQAAENFPQPAATLPAAGEQQRTAGVAATAMPPASQQQVQQGLGGERGQQLGFSVQPLVDNSPFDSGSLRGLGIWSGASSAALLLVLALLLL